MKKQRQGWHERYLSLRYSPTFNCLDFVIRVQREIFNRQVEIPPSILPAPVKAGDYQDGDIALFNDRRQQPHIGVLMLNRQGRCYLVHNNRATRGVSAEPFPLLISPALQLINVYRPQ